MTRTSKKGSILDAIGQIEEWNKHLEHTLKNEKLEKMAQSPYYFFRGTNHLFWNYFAGDTRLNKYGTKHSQTWIQADLHAYNYGIYANSHGEIVYALNDFDEACIADYQFDLWRMATSMVLIAKENEFMERNIITSFISSFSEAYIQLLTNYLKEGKKILNSVTKKNAYGKLDETLEHVEKKESREKMLEQWTFKEEGRIIFDLSYPKLGAVSKDKAAEIKNSMPGYLATLENKDYFNEDYFEIIDIARRISTGMGSYGTPRYYILIKGEGEEKHEHRILDAKLQYKPAPYWFLDEKFRQEYDKQFTNEGQRHKEAYMALNDYNDKHLGWIELSEGVFSIRERLPYKSYLQTKILNSEQRFNKIAQQWGHILGTAHVKAYPKFNVQEVIDSIQKSAGGFTKLVNEVAFEYAEYNAAVFKGFMNHFFLDE